MFQAGRKEPSEALDRAIDNMCKKTKDLRRQVRPEFFLFFVLPTLPTQFLENNYMEGSGSATIK